MGAVPRDVPLRRYRPGRIIETLARYDPDVVLLQEVDDGVPRSRRDRQVDLLGDALGLPLDKVFDFAQDFGCINVIDYHRRPRVRLLNWTGDSLTPPP